LEEAAVHLRRANERAPGQAEIFMESFRLAEVEGRTSELGSAGILALAITTDPDLAAEFSREAERFLAEGRRREEAARERATPETMTLDFSAADRAFEAAAVRLAGTLHAESGDVAAMLARARAEAEAGEWRSSLARYRAVLSWAALGDLTPGRQRADRLDALADLLSQAAKVATRVDGELARMLYARRRATLGAALLERQEWAEARRVLEKAREETPQDGEVRVGLARALVRLGEPDAAAAALVEALRLDASQADAIRRTPEFAPLLSRREVRLAMGAAGGG
ncbi:MAG: tetratricopeptide repeat protein, partial [Planctomycetota bacterium]